MKYQSGERTALRLYGVTKTYVTAEGLRTALDKVSCSAKSREIVFIVGRNGSGKTSVLRAIAGDIEYQGTILWLNKGSEDEGGTPISKKDVTWLPQDISEVAAASLRVNELMRICDGKAVKRLALHGCMNWLFRPHDKSFIRQPISELSGGQRQLLFGAIALSRRKPILLLDEVFRPLDPVTTEAYWKMVRYTVDECQGIALIVSHDLVLALDRGDRIWVMNSGKLIFNKLSSQAKLQELVEPIGRR